MYGSISNVKEIINILSDADHKYYNIGDSSISDKEYDDLKEKLKILDPNNPYLKRVGCKVMKSKMKLPYFLPSLDKIKDINRLDKWINKQDVIITEKLDGVSAMLIKNNDEFNLYTRGDGFYGQNISNILPFIKGISNINENVICRGELIISKENYRKYNILNQRNVITGLLASKNPDKNILNLIEFISYEIINPIYKPSNQLKLLNQYGFNVPNMKHFSEINDIMIYLQTTKEESKYDIDGLVLTIDKEYDRVQNGFPKYSIAYKSDEVLEYKDVKVMNVEWNISVNGYIKPTILISPTLLNNVLIQRVTGNNASFIKNNNIGKDSLIRIIRSGDVIPKVVNVINGTKADFPSNIKWKWTESNVDIVIDEENNDELNKKKLSYFFEKIKITGLKEGTINKIYENTNLKSIKDILHCEKGQLICKGIGEKTANTIYENIKNGIKDIDLGDLMIGSKCFGKGIGDNKIKMILNEYDNNIDNINENNIKKVEGISLETMKEFIENIDKFKLFLEDIDIEYRKEIKNKSKNDLICCFSGFRDEELKKQIENNGGQVKESLTKKCNILIVKENDENNTKQKQAKEIGIEIITKEEFIKNYLN
jgi:DNA ligase (NAD+)